MEYNEKFLLGKLDFNDEYYEERKIDSKQPTLPKIGLANIEVYDNEGDYNPHIHIFNKDKSFDCCICLDQAKYFKHGNHKDEMNSRQLKIFNEFMLDYNRAEYRAFGRRVSNWDVACQLWVHSGNKNNKFPKEQPDYTQTKESIHS
jgi:hypothetical protein